jgi:hypothetical protein
MLRTNATRIIHEKNLTIKIDELSVHLKVSK